MLSVSPAPFLAIEISVEVRSGSMRSVRLRSSRVLMGCAKGIRMGYFFAARGERMSWASCSGTRNSGLPNAARLGSGSTTMRFSAATP